MLTIVNKEVSQCICCGGTRETLMLAGKAFNLNENLEWETVWAGNQVFSSEGSFEIPGLSADTDVQISAEAEFTLYEYDPYNNQTITNTQIRKLNDKELPVTVYGNYESYVRFTHSNNKISFEFVPYEENYKGFVTNEVPTKVTFTSIKQRQ